MTKHNLVAFLASALVLFGLCTAKTNPGTSGSPEVLTRIFQMLEDLSNRVEAIDGEIRELRNSIGNDTLKSSIDEGFQEFSSSLMSCSVEELATVISDIKDECKDNSHNCSRHATCQDSLFGFNCTCRPGYTGDGFTCEDIDECSTGDHLCHEDAECTNTLGSYTCECILPAIGDGRNYCILFECRALDGLGCVLPVHERMDFQSALKNCQKEGGQLIEGITTQDQMNTLKYRYEFSFEFEPTKPHHHDVWVGIQQGKWISDGTPVNRSFWTDDPLSHVGDEECTVMALQLKPVSYWSMDNCALKLPSFCNIP